MLINGKWVDNLTCPRCRYRHPPFLSCLDAALIAERDREHEAKKKAKLLDGFQSAEDLEIDAIIQMVENEASCREIRAAIVKLIERIK